MAILTNQCTNTNTLSLDKGLRENTSILTTTGREANRSSSFNIQTHWMFVEQEDSIMSHTSLGR